MDLNSRSKYIRFRGLGLGALELSKQIYQKEKLACLKGQNVVHLTSLSVVVATEVNV